MVHRIHRVQATTSIGALSFLSRRWKARTQTDIPNMQTENPMHYFVREAEQGIESQLAVDYPLEREGDNWTTSSVSRKQLGHDDSRGFGERIQSLYTEAPILESTCQVV